MARVDWSFLSLTLVVSKERRFLLIQQRGELLLAPLVNIMGL